MEGAAPERRSKGRFHDHSCSFPPCHRRCGGLCAGNDRPPSLPAVVYSVSASVAAPPLWVSSRVAFDKNGDLRAALFEPGFRTMLEANRAANAEGGCRAALGAPVIEDHAPKGNLDEVTTSGVTIVSGDVVGADAGFYNGD